MIFVYVRKVEKALSQGDRVAINGLFKVYVRNLALWLLKIYRNVNLLSKGHNNVANAN